MLGSRLSNGFPKFALILGAGIFSLCLSPKRAVAQVTGTISGYITDQSKLAVADARVTATMVQQDLLRTTQTDPTGFYDFVALPPGVYTVAVEKPGFERTVQSGITVTVLQNVRADVILRVGAITQSVTVTGQVPLVDTRSSTVSGLVDDQRIVDLPLNGRNVIGLAATLPGVLGVNAPQNLTNSRTGPEMDVNGGTQNANLFTFDGGFFNEPSRNTGMNYPPPDAIQEFRIQTANFSAEYGRNAGAQVDAVSKAGTNGFHGTLWEFVRNDDFNARNFFSATVPGLKQNQFGGAAGGPIRRDKVFFFGSYQDLRDRPQAVPTKATLPSAAQRSGNFSSLLPGKVLSDPINTLTGLPMVDSGGNPCVAGNIIDPNCISAAGQKVLSYVPQSTAGGTLVALSNNPQDDAMYLGRIDWIQSSKHTLFGHAYVDHNNQTYPFGSGGNIPGYGTRIYLEETDSVTLNDTYVFSSNWINQAVASYLRTTTYYGAANTIMASQLGINLANYAPYGFLGFNVSGAFNMAYTGFTHFVNNNYEYRDSMSWTRGRHNIKFGADVYRIQWETGTIATPQFAFNGSRTGNAVADLVLGSFYSLNTSFGVRAGDNFNTSPSFFIQDEFKVKPRLLLTFGVRYEPYFFWNEKNNRLTSFSAGQQSTVVPDAPVGILFPGDSGIPRTLAHSDLNNFAPRVGFAWDVFGDGKTSVRGAYGAFYEAVNQDIAQQTNAPYAGVQLIYNGIMDNPYGSLGLTAPPVALTGKFGCVPSSASPGISCSLFPLPLSGEVFTNQNLKTPYVQTWNLSIQRQLTPSIMLEGAYIGSIGTKLAFIDMIDPAQFIPGTTFNAATGLETTLSTPSNDNQRVITEPGIMASTTEMVGNDYRSWEHSFQTQLTKRFTHGISLKAAYTLAKSLTDAEGPYLDETIYNELSDPWNVHAYRGRTFFDRRNAFVASYLWSPSVHAGQRWKNLTLGGWTFGGITTLQSGAPMTFYTGTDVALDGTGLGFQTAFLSGQPIAMSHANRGAMVAQFFNTGAFVNPTCGYKVQAGNSQSIEQQNCTPFGIKYSLLGHYGQSGSGILSGPGLSNTDFSAIKNFSFKEPYKVQFRAEFFNIFNQVNFANPDTTVTDGTFGQILSASSGRVIQLALKFMW